jgi:hypothetical protein
MEQFKQRLDNQDTKLLCLEKKIDIIMEQVTLGKHMIGFAKMMGWVIGVMAAAAELYRASKGG